MCSRLYTKWHYTQKENWTRFSLFEILMYNTTLLYCICMFWISFKKSEMNILTYIFWQCCYIVLWDFTQLWIVILLDSTYSIYAEALLYYSSFHFIFYYFLLVGKENIMNLIQDKICIIVKIWMILFFLFYFWLSYARRLDAYFYLN